MRKILKSIHIKNEPLNGKGIYFEGKICNCSDKIENGKMKFKFDENTRNRLREEHGINENTFVLGHVGRFTYEKNQIFCMSKLWQTF